MNFVSQAGLIRASSLCGSPSKEFSFTPADDRLTLLKRLFNSIVYNVLEQAWPWPAVQNPSRLVHCSFIVPLPLRPIAAVIAPSVA